jgi:ATP-binding cassette subfamily B protein
LKLLDWLRKYINKYKTLFCVSVSFLFIEALCDLLQPTIMAKIIDVGIAQKNMHVVITTGGLMLLVTAIGAIGAVVRNNVSSRVSQRFGAELRTDLFRHIQGLSYENIEKFDNASLVTRLTNDVTQVQNFVNGMMRIFVKAPLLCIGSIIMAVLLNPSMSLILVAVIPIIVFIIVMSAKTGYPFFSRVQKSIDKVNGVTREYLSGVRLVKAFNRFDFEEKRFSVSNEELAGVQTSAMRVMSIFSPLIMLFVNMGIVVVLLIGGFKVDNGSIQVGKVIAFTNYMLQISSSLMMISTVFTMFVRARASTERIGEVFNTRDTVKSPEKPVESGNSGSIEFDNVSFCYAKASGEPVLSDITFKCDRGQTLGIIGTTGSGKTSLVNLIPRFYDVSGGSVKFGGIDVRELNEHTLRGSIAVVPQKDTLFTGTIADNIRWGKDDATQEEIEAAAKTAQADGFIKNMPDGYGTILGQGGVNLSGGQKQRISIARALIRNPEILILDDSTSAVDVITEAKIRQGLRERSKESIYIIIAQRISSIMAADRIIVLDDGKISDIGSHAELLKRCTVYRELYESQYGKQEVM